LWGNLGGIAHHELTSTDVVNVVAMKEHGITVPTTRLYAAGSFMGSLKYWGGDVKTNQWYPVQNSPTTYNDTIVSPKLDKINILDVNNV
jgi:hypothetical protein